MNIDMTAEGDLDTVAQIAFEISEKLREEDLAELNRELVNLCRFHPVKSAQIITALAAWLDPETPTTVLWDRVESITASRVDNAIGVRA
jgi:hypothetical protein